MKKILLLALVLMPLSLFAQSNNLWAVDEVTTNTSFTLSSSDVEIIQSEANSNINVLINNPLPPALNAQLFINRQLVDTEILREPGDDSQKANGAYLLRVYEDNTVITVGEYDLDQSTAEKKFRIVIFDGLNPTGPNSSITFDNILQGPPKIKDVQLHQNFLYVLAEGITSGTVIESSLNNSERFSAGSLPESGNFFLRLDMV
jgi:hypothetical protein